MSRAFDICSLIRMHVSIYCSRPLRRARSIEDQFWQVPSTRFYLMTKTEQFVKFSICIVVFHAFKLAKGSSCDFWIICRLSVHLFVWQHVPFSSFSWAMHWANINHTLGGLELAVWSASACLRSGSGSKQLILITLRMKGIQDYLKEVSNPSPNGNNSEIVRIF